LLQRPTTFWIPWVGHGDSRGKQIITPGSCGEDEVVFVVAQVELMFWGNLRIHFGECVCFFGGGWSKPKKRLGS
jgi:hypothetical protein